MRAALVVACAVLSTRALAQPTDTTQEAKAFLEIAESRLSTAEDLSNAAEWVRATNITPDTDWLAERLDADRT